MVAGIKYEPLAEMFEGRASQKGWVFRLVKREGDIALYEKESEGLKVYEVIRIRYHKGGECMLGGKKVVFEPKERYPRDEDFGVHGFSYGRLEDALDRFSLLKADVGGDDCR